MNFSDFVELVNKGIIKLLCKYMILQYLVFKWRKSAPDISVIVNGLAQLATIQIPLGLSYSGL